MYAVIKTGGKQYRVQAGDFLRIQKLDQEVGQSVRFSEVLFVSEPGEESSKVWLGKPLVENAFVEAEVVANGRGKKILIHKFRRRTRYRRKMGHRQDHTEILVTGLENGAGGKSSLSSEDKQTKLKKFFTLLTPKGGRPRKVRAAAAEGAEASEAASPKARATKKKAAPKKSSAKAKGK